MAAKKKKKNTVPKTAEQKGAESALQASQRLALEGQRARTAQSSRGAFKARQLRSSGTSLQQYDLAKFKSDPFPSLGGGGIPNGGGVGPATATATPKPRGATSGAKGKDGKAGIRQQENAKAKNRRKDNMNSPNITEKMQEQAAWKAKQKAAAAAAAAKAKKKKQAKLTDSKGGNTKAIGTKPVMS